MARDCRGIRIWLCAVALGSAAGHRLLAQCTQPESDTWSGGSHAFPQFDPAVGTLTGVRIQYSGTVSGWLSGQNGCSSCSNFKFILCGYHRTQYPGGDAHDNFRLCTTHYVGYGQTVLGLSLGGFNFEHTVNLSNQSWPAYIGTGTVNVTSSVATGGYVPCYDGQPCPPPPPPWPGVPCDDFGDLPCFNDAFSSTTSISFQITYTYTVNPVIAHQPQNTASCPQGPAQFDVQVSGSGSYTYEWQMESPENGGTYVDLPNGTYIEANSGLTLTAAGANTPELTVSQVALGQHSPALRFRVRISGSCGTTTSDAAVLSVTVVPGDVNGDCVVDFADAMRLMECLLGPDNGLGTGCGPLDFDLDGDVEMRDAAEFQTLL